MARSAVSLIIISAALQRAFGSCRELRLDATDRLVKFRFGPSHLSERCLHPLRTQYDKSEREKER